MHDTTQQESCHKKLKNLVGRKFLICLILLTLLLQTTILFCSLQNHLEETAFTTQEEVKIDICKFFKSKLKEFYNNGINKLINRWKEVIDNHGKYIND